MSELASHLLDWAGAVAALGTIVVAIGWEIWDGSIRPRLVSRAEIVRLADEILAKHADAPERAASIEEHHHWHHSDSFQQGVWNRVRHEIRRRQNAMTQR